MSVAAKVSECLGLFQINRVEQRRRCENLADDSADVSVKNDPHQSASAATASFIVVLESLRHLLANT